MSHVRIGVFAALTMVAWLGPLSAQQRPLALGQRVRVDSLHSGTFSEGRLVRLVGDTVVLADGPRERAFVLGGHRHLWVPTGTRSHTWGFAALGAGIGIVAGALTYSPPPPPPPCTGNPIICGIDFRGVEKTAQLYAQLRRAAVGSLVGMGIGALIGSQVRTTLWAPVLPDELDRLRVTIAPLPSGRLGLGASLAF
jgi:hypothetical protein